MSTLTSPTQNKPGQAYRKPRADVYTLMLLVALVAIIIACLCLYFEMKRFDFDYKSAPKPPPPVAILVQPRALHETPCATLPQSTVSWRPIPA